MPTDVIRLFFYFEFSITTTPAAESFNEHTVGCEHLNPIVTGIGNNDVALIINGYSPAKERQFNCYRFIIVS